MPEPDAVTIALHLDDPYEANGPLTVLSGSHTLGLVATDEAAPRRELAGQVAYLLLRDRLLTYNSVTNTRPG
ncbi:phytanoyl-CoA dioxygenase family protein [Streptomyces cupreus]|uniref:Phytanoyl-CoA dioxygenase family protein n=1 Tax=Streptomyces cupreus TaxID=2759956 RepID=A0A7X1J4U9_9ACTN|nr:phytanoyl-CoA dioxygenase family protein [Streptomyces cupreus]MBC2904243.1 phytanoyl-CoA dioxygenase family protein [Streptomyces cupreus]